MAFIKTSDSIIIDAALTEKGRKYLARGTFKISKFALGDDEIDYTLCDSDSAKEDKPGFKHMQIFEAYSDRHKNIQYGLNSFDKGILYLRDAELEDPKYNPEHPHAFLLFLPILKQNTVLKTTPSLRDSVYYISVNDETTNKIKKLAPGFRFAESNKSGKIKFVVETGIHDPAGHVDAPLATYEDRKHHIVEKFLLDQDLFIYVDDRFTAKILGITKACKFKNFPSGQSTINLDSLREYSAISLENQFDNYATYVIKTIDNLISDFDSIGEPDADLSSINFSDIRGPRANVSAFNIKVAPELKVNSTGDRDFRYSEFGSTDQAVFGGSDKFDYIDTTIYMIGATTNSQIRIPIRIIRYSGT